MKSLLILLGLIGLALAAQNNLNIVVEDLKEDAHIQAAYLLWATHHGKHTDRFRIFKENVEKIKAHNAQPNVTFTLGLTKFADMTVEEFRADHRGCYRYRERAHECTHRHSNTTAPSSVDWRTKGAVTAVKDQGQCGSCWSFGTTGSIEGAWFLSAKSGGQLTALSEAQLVDCDTKGDDQGCNGGLPTNAYQYVIKHGLESEADYPYTPSQGKCEFSANKVVATISSYKAVTPGSETDLLDAAAITPIAVGIDASHNSFQLYTGGVYVEPECSSQALDHAVLVVGYGSDANGGDYWIVKNSWGPNWGEQGYIRMARNKNNQCGIATDPAYPIV